MEVKPGYKQTEVGGIPEEWESSKIGDFSFVTKLAGFEYTIHFDYSKSGPVIAVRALNIKNGTLDLTEVHTIPRKTSDDLPRSKLVKGDLVISYVGTLGRVAMIPEDEKFHLAPNVAKICVDKDRVAPEFLAQFLNSFNGQKLIFDAAASTTQAALSMGNLRGIFFVRPPLPEQRAIATALSDVDGLLGGLDRLIAKKRDLKQAAMQQLLTGQTRLPDFHGEWEVKRLGDVGSTYGGLTGKTKADFGEGPARYITFMNVMANVVIDCETFEPVQVSPTEAQNRAIKGDLFFNGSSETPEEVAMCSVLLDEVQGVYLNSFCFGFRFHHDAEADGLFLAYYLRSKEGRELMKSLAQGSTRYNLSKVALLKSPLRLPRLLEQTAIASVLTEMDAELAALTQRREKTRALKQAMMQELLTGRTRLV